MGRGNSLGSGVPLLPSLLVHLYLNLVRPPLPFLPSLHPHKMRAVVNLITPCPSAGGWNGRQHQSLLRFPAHSPFFSALSPVRRRYQVPNTFLGLCHPTMNELRITPLTTWHLRVALMDICPARI